MSMNENGSLMMVPKTGNRPSEIFRGYTFISLIDTLYIRKCLDEAIVVDVLDYHTAIQNFNGFSFFEFFKEEHDIFELIYTYVQSQDLQNEKVIDSAGIESDNIWIRQLFWTLNLPMKQPNSITADFQLKQLTSGDSIRKMLEKASKMIKIKQDKIKEKEINTKQNLMQNLLFDDDNTHIIDPLLKLLMLSSEFKLGDLISDFGRFKKVFEISSNEIHKFLGDSFFVNLQCKEITNMKWDPNNKFLCFTSITSLLSETEIKKQFEQLIKTKKGFFKQIIFWLSRQSKILKSIFSVSEENDEKLKTVPVEVKIVDISWIENNL